MEKFNFSGFLKVPAFIGYETEDGKTKHMEQDTCRLNPMNITSYWASQFKDDNGNWLEVTKVQCAHYIWIVNIPFDEFDKFFSDIERGMSVNDE